MADGGASARRFLASRLTPAGGFRGRSGAADLYYTAFGLAATAALRAESPISDRGFEASDFGRVAAWLAGFGDGAGLDLVHLACLARCLTEAAELPGGPGRVGAPVREGILALLAGFRTADGGFGPDPAGPGTAYGCFLALGACQDLAAEPPDPQALARCVQTLRTEDGAYANAPSFALGTTPTTAAAVTVLRECGRGIDGETVDWLLARHTPAGGFVALPGAPVADLLSTAVALHALAVAGVDLAPFAAPCRRFVLGLQGFDGGFRGNALDGQSDCEYTWYALLALGHLGQSRPFSGGACSARSDGHDGPAESAEQTPPANGAE